MIDSILQGLFTLFILLFCLEWGYILCARRMKWVATCAKADDVKTPPVLAGGIIFLIPAAISFLALPPERIYTVAFCSIVAVIILSFIDDLHPLGVKLRLCVQTLACTLPVLTAISIDSHLHFGWLPGITGCLVALIFVIAFMNEFNFMDGINGLTPAYAIVVLATLLLFGLPAAIIVPFLAGCFVMAFFNFRRNALIFCGDVGAISLGAIIAALIVISPCFPASIVFVSLYICDATLTIIYRIAKRQNIFKAHHKHLYQLLTTRVGIPHLCVSTVYALMQLIINLSFILFCHTEIQQISFAAVCIVLLSLIWIKLHTKLINRPAIKTIYSCV